MGCLPLVVSIQRECRDRALVSGEIRVKVASRFRSATKFSYQRERFAKQPGFDHTVCPER
jgi:hypothetical protein